MLVVGRYYLEFSLPIAYYWLLITELAPGNDKMGKLLAIIEKIKSLLVLNSSPLEGRGKVRVINITFI
ncbi:MAG: hypothetical protein KBI07_07600 [Candidatus Atribacteria bacterium]|nr:hypothetical protein [Candidatus Atribacteria bacterium]